MTLIEKVAKALEDNFTDDTFHWKVEARAAIAVVLSDLLEWGKKQPKPNFAPISRAYVDAYARENGIEL